MNYDLSKHVWSNYFPYFIHEKNNYYVEIHVTEVNKCYQKGYILLWKMLFSLKYSWVERKDRQHGSNDNSRFYDTGEVKI